MKKEHEESRGVVLGLLIGGVVGASALYYLRATQNRKTPLLKKVGRTLSEVGEMLEHTELGSGADMVKSIEKKIPSGADILGTLTDWVDAGMNLWKTFKKG